MALPYLIKHIYSNASEEVIRRGKKIHTSGNVEQIEHDELLGNITFRVKDDSYAIYYKVHIQNFKEAEQLKLRCTCPYNLTEVCRHKAAALFQLQELLDKNLLGDKAIMYNQQHTVVKMKQLDMKMIRMLSSAESYTAAQDYLRSKKAKIIEAKEEKVVAELEYENLLYSVVIQKNEERNFDTSCNNSNEIHHPLCVQKVIVFLQLLASYGPNYFDSIRNWDAVKNKLLSIYGYSLQDNLEGKFEFTYQDNKPFLRVLDSSIKRIITPATIEPSTYAASTTAPTILSNVNNESIVLNTPIKSIKKLGVVITQAIMQYPYFQIEAILGEPDDDFSKYIGRIEKIDLNKFVNTELFNEADKILLQQIRKLMPIEVNKYLTRNSPFSGIWENIIQQHTDDLPEETRRLIHEYLHPKIKKLFSELHDSNYSFYLPAKKLFLTANLQQAEINNTFIAPTFSINFHNQNFEISCSVKLPLAEISIADNESSSTLLFQYQQQFFTWQKTEDIVLIEQFLPTGKLIIPSEKWLQQLENFILPLTKNYIVDFGNLKKEDIKNVLPTLKIILKEKGDYLLFQPVYNYDGIEVSGIENEKIVIPYNDKLVLIYRNIDAEKSLLKTIENLHSSFIKPDNYTLALKGADVLKNNWFFLFIDSMKELNVAVYGFETLKHYKFNTAKPSTKIYISSNTDWFDAKVEILFGEQKVTVADVKNALAKKQQFVHLQDGTLGILPEEWIKKYALLFKVGEGKLHDLKLSKYQYSIVEDLYNERNEAELFLKLEEKYDKLRYNYEIKKIETPQHLKSVLRPYQESGFQWLNYLREVQWGGILADDMGLGKTIQALCFMHYLKQQNKNFKALVVCPTSLMYNWQNEIKKFTPSLNFYIHHGGLRLKNNLHKLEIDVIITTYGTLRSDIKEFAEVEFEYVVLDESQAIKNPSSKIAKAACVLKANNKLCLSGTPLQNNTFDIFAQMNFLNPGMLGSQDFFKNEFAVPIDKFGEKEQKEHLRKLLYPFILRRTKEQVAKDLPEKQEMILFCEMGSEQRKIYDAYRNDFRDKILGVVQEQGIQKSQLTILQGLMKLRQICDSPAIIKDVDGDSFPNTSVKLEEIGREITENISNHKALIFSQFLGMLALIKNKLKELGVNYEYFDGSTSALDREKAIHRFQNDEACRVFLISLKAGGVGLNLTAADYVYIVDPWWNPAVEQQAIDRTHRIGQTKNIFAYRMICNDTVEDKIIKLQERKKALAKDLITDDEGFVKSLTKDDVEYLFS